MCFYLRNWQVTFLLYTLGVFISEYTAKAFTEPRDYRVVFLIQKTEWNSYMKFHSVLKFYIIIPIRLFLKEIRNLNRLLFHRTGWRTRL